MPRFKIKRKFQREFVEFDIKTPAICRLDGLKKPVVFCMEGICNRLQKHHKRRKRCDEVVFCELKKSTTGIYCVENKEGYPDHVDLSHVQEQLQGGANVVASLLFASRLSDGRLSYEPFSFSPILATPTGMLATWRMPLLQLPVEMKGESKIISVVKKNEKLPPL